MQGLSPAGCAALAEALGANSSLSELNLAQNALGNEGQCYFALPILAFVPPFFCCTIASPFACTMQCLGIRSVVFVA